METNKKSFRDELTTLAEIAELIDRSSIFPNSKFNIDIELNEEKYKSIISNFREIDRKNERFSIVLDNVEFRFALKK